MWTNKAQKWNFLFLFLITMWDDPLVPRDLIQQLFSPPFEYTEHAAQNPIKLCPFWHQASPFLNSPSSSHTNYWLFSIHTAYFKVSVWLFLPRIPLLSNYPGNLKFILWTNVYNSTQLVEMVQCLPPPKHDKLNVEALRPPQRTRSLRQNRCSIIIC